MPEGQFAHGMTMVKFYESFLPRPRQKKPENPDIITVDEFLRRCGVKVMRARFKSRKISHSI